MKHYLIIMLIAFALLTPHLAQAQSMNETSKALITSESHIQEMLDNGFYVERMRDILIEANQLFEAQKALEESGGEPDYSIIIKSTDSIREIKDMAFHANDEITVFQIAIAELSDTDAAEVTPFLDSALEEFRNERYEQAMASVDEGYQKISELQALSIRVVSFLDAGRKNIVGFVQNNWQLLLTVVIALMLVAVFFKGEISSYRIKKRIRKLDAEKRIIYELIKKTQRDYFEKGNMPEVSYRTRTKKFDELIRDINRQIPLLKAELQGRKSLTARFQKASEKEKKKEKHKKQVIKKHMKETGHDTKM